MDYLSAILLGEDPLKEQPSTLQHPQTPPTNPTNPLEPVQDSVKVLKIPAQHTHNNPQQPHNNRERVEENVVDVEAVLSQNHNIFLWSGTSRTRNVVDVEVLWGLSDPSLELQQALEHHNPLSDAGWSGHWRERIQMHLQALEDWVWRDEYDLMRTANNGLPKAQEQAREKLTRWYMFMLERKEGVSL